MKTGLVILFFLFIPLISVKTQISRGGQPMLTKSYRSVVPPFQLDKTEIEKAIIRSIEDDERIYGKKPLTVAIDQKVLLNPENSGNWVALQNGYKVWRLEIYSEGAEALAVFFDRFRLKEGVMLFLYTPDFEEILGGFNHLTHKFSGILQTAFLPGSRLVIELQVPEGKEYGQLSIGSFSHAFIDIFSTYSSKDGFFGLSGDCEVDINCPEGEAWQKVKRSVCRIIFKRNDFTTELCTGTLINNTSEDGKALFYTANHCIKTDFEAQTAVLYFNYESEQCNGNDGDVSMTLSGTSVLATSDSLDFSLLLLSEDPPEEYQPYFAGWSRSLNPPLSSVTIHHPQGDVKKISRDKDRALTEYQEDNPPEWLFTGSVPGAFWRIGKWESGVTEFGSSGSPLFNQLQLITGNLTGGDAYCTYPYNDYFSKFFMNWDYYPEPGRQLKYWLDSLNTGFEFIGGYDPTEIADTFSVELFTLYPNPNNGYFTLHTSNLSIANCIIRVYTLTGALLADYTVSSLENLSFNLSGLENGIYLMDIIMEGYREKKKIVITK